LYISEETAIRAWRSAENEERLSMELQVLRLAKADCPPLKVS
jgi:hypothetical protein